MYKKKSNKHKETFVASRNKHMLLLYAKTFLFKKQACQWKLKGLKKD